MRKPRLAGGGGSRRRQVYAVCASLTARDSEHEPGEGPRATDTPNPSPDLARLRLRSVTLSRKRARGREIVARLTKLSPSKEKLLPRKPRGVARLERFGFGAAVVVHRLGERTPGSMHPTGHV